jgi:hypothetical protein
MEAANVERKLRQPAPAKGKWIAGQSRPGDLRA